MPTIFAVDAADHVCPYKDWTSCLGPKCMAWAWVGPRADHCTTTNLVPTEEGERPLGDPPTPDGDGWEMDGQPYETGYHQSAKLKLPKATAQRWIKERGRSQGHCARHHGDQEYGW